MVNAGPETAVRSSEIAEAESAKQSSGKASPRPALRQMIGRLLTLQELAPATALVLLVLLVGLTHTRFFSAISLEGNIEVAAVTSVTAIGMVFLLAIGEIDISVGGIYGICFFVCAKLGADGVNRYVAGVAAVGLGFALGFANGIMVRVFKAPAIIVTLGTYSLYAGLVEVISGGNDVGQGLNQSASFFTFLGGNFLQVPIAGWIALLLCVGFTILLTKSRMGAMIRASGSNRSGAAFSGIPVTRLRTYCLMLTGGLAGFAGVLDLAYAQGGDATVGTGYELQVIAAAIIGGTAITGGTGSVPGALIGALLVATINGGLVFFNVNPLWDSVVTGVVILLAVGSTALLKNRREERQARLGV